jgi:hypothetical protein
MATSPCVVVGNHLTDTVNEQNIISATKLPHKYAAVKRRTGKKFPQKLREFFTFFLSIFVRR